MKLAFFRRCKANIVKIHAVNSFSERLQKSLWPGNSYCNVMTNKILNFMNENVSSCSFPYYVVWLFDNCQMPNKIFDIFE